MTTNVKDDTKFVLGDVPEEVPAKPKLVKPKPVKPKLNPASEYQIRTVPTLRAIIMWAVLGALAWILYGTIVTTSNASGVLKVALLALACAVLAVEVGIIRKSWEYLITRKREGINRGETLWAFVVWGVIGGMVLAIGYAVINPSGGGYAPPPLTSWEQFQADREERVGKVVEQMRQDLAPHGIVVPTEIVPWSENTVDRHGRVIDPHGRAIR